MARLQFLIPLDPGGYHWVRRPAKTLNTDPATCLSLVGAQYAELRRQCERKENWHLDAYEFPATYDPAAREPALFRIFAELDGSESAVLAFANRYGDIAEISEILFEENAITLADWRERIIKIRAAVKKADQLTRKTASEKEIRAFVSDLLEGLDINVNLQASKDGSGLDVKGFGLINAMKLQLVDAVTERKGYRKCEFCGRPFELRPQINRADRLFCSDTCRVKAYKRRKKEAVALRQQGLTMREIAKRTATDIASVKKWIESAKKEA